MRLAIVIEVDDSRLGEYIDEMYDPGEEKPVPAEFFAGRLRELCEDEISLALWGWHDKVGMTASVEAIP